MRYALLSDIHANWQAWTAVRDDMAVQDVDCSLCLGDVIGYGPQPQRVLDDVRQHCQNFVLGNHDAVVCGKIDPDLFNDNARFVIDWTCQQLGDEPAAFFNDVPMVIGDDGILCAHAEIAIPNRWSYIFEAEQARSSFEASSAQLMFVGHTHKPIVCRYDQGALEGSIGAGIQSLDLGVRYLFNVGSVGDPRDGQPMASYCIYDDERRSVEFRRLAFDYAAFRDDLDRSRLPVRPMFLDCIGEISSARTQVMSAPNMDMAMGRIPSELPAASVHINRPLKIRFKKRRKFRTPSSTRTTQTPLPEELVPPPPRRKAAVLAACCILVAMVIVLGSVLTKKKKPNPVVPTDPIASTVSVAEKQTNVARWQAYGNRMRTDAGMVAYYDFEEKKGETLNNTAGPRHDYAPEKLNGERNGATAWTDGRWKGKGGLRFLGGNWLDCGRNSSTDQLSAGNFSLCAWIKTSGKDDDDIVSNGTNTNGTYLLQTTNLGKAKGHVWYGKKSNALSGNTVVNDGEWHLLCQVVDDAKIYLYVDGTLDASADLLGAKVGSSNELIIGARSTEKKNEVFHFDGTIDEVLIFNRALTAQEINETYRQGSQ